MAVLGALAFLFWSFGGNVAAIDNDVTVSGSTVPPGYSREEGFALNDCPKTHPYVLNGGQHCCKSAVKAKDTTLAADCDGEQVALGTSLECCLWGDVQPCPFQEGCGKAETDACIPTPTIVSHDTIYDSRFPAEAVLTFEQCEVHAQNYFLGKNGATNVKFVADLGCTKSIKRFILRNTQNGYSGERATKDFTIEVSYDNVNWKLILTDTLASVASYDLCELPLETFHTPAHGRYVRFTYLNYYNSFGGGLNYISWEFLD